MGRVYRGQSFYEEAIDYNKKWPVGTIAFFSPHRPDTRDFARDVSDFQKDNDLTIDGKLGPNTISHIRQYYFDNMPQKEMSDYLSIARVISRMEGKFWSVNRDGEYRGLFDRNGKKHWASGKTHIGLSFGYIQFTQHSGSLGTLLTLMNKKDHQKFKKVFGEHYRELIEVTTRTGSQVRDGRSPRVQKVGGYDLWEDHWVSKFQKAGRMPVFQEAQMELAISNYMRPAIRTCEELNISSERGLAMVFDRSVHFGPRGAKRLLSKVRGDDPEHLFLRRLLKEWSSRRWYSRVTKIFYELSLEDCSFSFT